MPVLIMNLKSMLSIFQNIHQAVPGSENTSKKHLVLVRLASLPILWALFQGYHMICKFLAPSVMILFPQRFEAYTTPYYFGIAMVNLLIWSLLAALWPRWGVGDAWHPHRGQGVVVLSIVALCLILIPLTHTLVPAPLIHTACPYETPFKRMGIVAWTMTPVQEEILFRGFLYVLALRMFQRRPTSSFRNVLPALILGAVWFALWHVTPPAIIWSMAGKS